ncbi:MAG TPA: hypothetical protein HPP83_10790, partial [Candidatus Hydrogenedentes bacterium]|nr:hypothetical protein [Candidatus Hydrogenedentota bacterium]
MTIANDDADTTQTPRADAWRGVFLCAALICCPVVYSFRLTSFLLAKEAVLWVCLCFCAASSMVRGRFSWGGYRAFLPLWVLVVVSGLFHLVLFPAKVPADVVTEITRWCALLVAAAFLCDLLRQRVWRRRLVNAWLFSAVLAAGLGLLQFANAISFLFPTFPGYTQRAYSVFGNQDLLGGYSAMAIPLCANRVLRRRPGPRCALLAMAILTPALLLSGSRSAWLAAVLGLIVAVPYRNLRFRPTALLCSVTIALVAATALLVPDATTSRIRNTAAEQDEGGRIRLWIWNGTLRMVRDVPWFGIGPGNYPYWSPRYLGEALRAPGGEQHRHNELHVRNAHSEPLEIFAETGVIGFVFCLWMLLRLIRCRGPEC